MRVASTFATLLFSGAVLGSWTEHCNVPGKTPGCDVLADRSVYVTPQLYYQHADGILETLKNKGTTITYQAHDQDVTPFPSSFRMLTEAKSSKAPGAVVSLACQGSKLALGPSSFSKSECEDDILATIHFPSCWNGKDHDKEDNSHVEYSSGIVGGECPSTHPIKLVHLSYEIVYAAESINQDGGKFVSDNGENTGPEYTGTFTNGWTADLLRDATKQCALSNESYDVHSCQPLAKSNVNAFNFAVQEHAGTEDVGELRKRDDINANRPHHGKKPHHISRAAPSGFRTRISKTKKALASPTVTSEANVLVTTPMPLSAAPAISTLEVKAKVKALSSSYVYNGCWNEGIGGLALPDEEWTDTEGVTVDSCVNHCKGLGFGIAGLEFGQVCFCGAQMSNAAALTFDYLCGLPCQGDKSQVCGGEGKLSVYKSG